jgi:hypothetical protein
MLCRFAVFAQVVLRARPSTLAVHVWQRNQVHEPVAPVAHRNSNQCLYNAVMNGYRQFFQNGLLEKEVEEFFYAGATNFFFTRDIPHERYINSLNIIRERYLYESCEISQDRGDHVWRIRPGRQNAAPVWRLDSGTLDELIEILDARPETVFIEYFKAGKAGQVFLRHKSKPSPKGEKLKSFLEIKHEYPEVEFIAFGSFTFKFYFQSGMDGSCIRVRTNTTNPNYINDYFKSTPDGTIMQYSALRKALRIAAQYRCDQVKFQEGKRLKMSHVRVVMMVLATPQYQEQIRGVELEQEYDAVKYLPDEFFPEDVDRPTELLPREIPKLSAVLPGDKILCVSCSLKYRCPLYEPGSVCTVPDSDGKALADFFNSRNSDDVLKGLQAVLTKQAQRVEGAVEAEEKAQKDARKNGEHVLYSDQVTKMLDGLQKNADKYLRLVDPRFTKPVVQINNNSLPQGPVPREIDPAAAREELVGLGIPRDSITAELIERYLNGTFNGPNEMQAIENGRTIDGELGF